MNITKYCRASSLATRLLVGALVAGLALAACGDDDSSNGDGAQSATGNGIDRAFVAAMIPHHESAVGMAKIAKRRGQSTFVAELADDIIRTQNTEITTMKAIASRLDGKGIKPTDLGVAEGEMGMDADMSELETAKPFDRVFIDMMIPHHQGAIRMARVELAKGSSAQVKKLATQIITAQAREIRAMNTHRSEAFGASSPAGGVPAGDDQGGAMPSMGH